MTNNPQPGRAVAGTVTVSGLLVGGLGIVVQIVSGVDFPPIPPGLVILLAGAAVVAFGPWRWAAVVGALAALSQSIGLFAAGQAPRLVDLSPLGGWLGLWIQLLGVTAATVAGIIATAQLYRRGPHGTGGPR